MEYLKFASGEAFSHTIERLTEGFWPAMIAIAILSMTAFLAHKIRGKEEFKEYLWDGFLGLCATVIAGVFLFLGYLFVVDPAREHRTLERQNQALTEAHSQIESDKIDLKKAQERASELSDALNMSKDSVQSGDKLKALSAQLERQNHELEMLKAHALTDAYIDPDEWPALTSEQLKSWGSALKDAKIVSVGVFWGQDVEANSFFKSLQTLGHDLNFEVTAGAGQENQPNQIDVIALTNDPSVPIVKGLLEGYRTGDEKVSIQYGNNGSPSDFGKIEIFIGERRLAPSSIQSK